jgi:hypothetical protein
LKYAPVRSPEKFPPEVKMRKLIVSLSVLALTACVDNTSPNVVAVNNDASIYFPSSPPPPPNDSGSVASSEYGEQPLFTRYFFNIPGNSGWLTFSRDQAPGVVITNTARISYSKGVFSGVGTVKYPAGGGIITLNLAGVSQSSTFNSSDKGYFSLVLNGSTWTGGGRTVSLAPVRLGLAVTRGDSGGGECSWIADVICGGS